MALVKETLHPPPTKTFLFEVDPKSKEPSKPLISERSSWGIFLSAVSRIVNAAGHVSGSTAFVAVASKTITFDVAQPDALYQVFLSWDTVTDFRWNNKTINGFDIVSIGGAITGNVDWQAVR